MIRNNYSDDSLHLRVSSLTDLLDHEAVSVCVLCELCVLFELCLVCFLE